MYSQILSRLYVASYCKLFETRLTDPFGSYPCLLLYITRESRQPGM